LSRLGSLSWLRGVVMVLFSLTGVNRRRSNG
jgi:hypothetical protein